MSSVNDRIKKISKYFSTFNIAEGAVYALVNLPSKWTVIPSLNVGDAEVKAVKDEQKGGYYFFTEFDNGYDCVFDAIEEVIKFNESIEEKANLLTAKAQELKELFENEDIEVLRTLKFVFEDDNRENTQTPLKKQGKKQATPKKECKKNNKKNTDEVKEETPVQSEGKKEEKENNVMVKPEPTPAADEKYLEGGSLMDFANDIIKEGE